MKKKVAITLFSFLCLQIFPLPVSAERHELAGHGTAEVRAFLNEPLFPEQKKDNASLSLQPEYRYIHDSGSMFTFIPFGRIDSSDDNRTHVDVRELNFLWVADFWELKLGVGKVFWGATEFVHLVDIINQTDLVEAPDGEDKLGQPMVDLAIPSEWGSFHFLLLPWFRERTFPGLEGRLRPPLEIDDKQALYENDDEENHIDFALRHTKTLGKWDLGTYYFQGTGREPLFQFGGNAGGAPVLLPFYEQIKQIAMDIQGMVGPWLVKLEACHRNALLDDFAAITGGFEYTFFDVAHAGLDLGVVGEMVYDGRNAGPITLYNDDVMVGLRATFNDAASSELLFGFIQDRKGSEKMLTLEASRRLGEKMKVSLDALSLIDIPVDSIALGGLRKDDHVRVELSYYF